MPLFIFTVILAVYIPRQLCGVIRYYLLINNIVNYNNIYHSYLMLSIAIFAIFNKLLDIFFGKVGMVQCSRRD
jgi:hypothetical protein